MARREFRSCPACGGSAVLEVVCVCGIGNVDVVKDGVVFVPTMSDPVQLRPSLLADARDAAILLAAADIIEQRHIGQGEDFRTVATALLRGVR